MDKLNSMTKLAHALFFELWMMPLCFGTCIQTSITCILGWKPAHVTMWMILARKATEFFFAHSIPNLAEIGSRSFQSLSKWAITYRSRMAQIAKFFFKCILYRCFWQICWHEGIWLQWESSRFMSGTAKEFSRVLFLLKRCSFKVIVNNVFLSLISFHVTS